MPSSSTISSSDKSKVKHALPSSSNKILTATVARIFVAYPSQTSWSYTGIEGALAFVRDQGKNTFYLRMVDLKGDHGIIWQHELYEPLSYNQDRTFLHTLEGDDFLIAFAFADDGEAAEFYKKINNRQKYAKSSSKSSGSVLKKKTKGGAGSGKIDKSMISSPSQFKHVAHMGFTTEKGFSSENVDPTWAALLDQLSNMGISKKDIEKNEGFIKDFVNKKGGTTANKAKKVPPPAPTRTTARKQPPPPPAPRSRPSAAAPPSSGSSAALTPAPAPPPPPPPARGSAAVAPIPPPPPSRGAGAASSVPPPPPPPPPARGGQASGAPPPPPPPPPLTGSSGAPPPPPPPPAAIGAAAPAAPPPGRANLLASIQGQSIHNLRKVDSSAASGSGPATPVASHAPIAEDGGDGGPDLASALAAALSARKENMGDSDEEESEEEW